MEKYQVTWNTLYTEIPERYSVFELVAEGEEVTCVAPSAPWMRAKIWS